MGMPFFLIACQHHVITRGVVVGMGMETSGESDLDSRAVEFRLGTLADLDQLLVLYAQLIPEQTPALPLARECLTRILNDSGHGWIAVAEYEGKVIATCQAVIYANIIRAPQPKAMIDSVVVDAARRGQGIGKGLMHWTMQELRARDCGLVLVATSFKRLVAHKLYEDLGFAAFGHSYLIDLATESATYRRQA